MPGVLQLFAVVALSLLACHASHNITTREKATSSAGKMATSSAGTRATSIALQLKVSSSAGAPALLLT